MSDVRSQSNRIYSAFSSLRRKIKRGVLFTPLDPLMGSLATVIERFVPRQRGGLVKDAEVTLQFGPTLVVPPGLPYAKRLMDSAYEPEVTAAVQSILSRGMSFVDAGANIGYYSVISATLVGSRGRVYAFEPDPDAFWYLQLNTHRNALGNVTLVQAALADRVAVLPFSSTLLDRGHLMPRSSTAPSIPVEVCSLDRYFASLGWPPIDLVKLDVEGAEHSALVGMRELSRLNPHLTLIMEINPASMLSSKTTLEQLRTRLSELGFKTTYVLELGKRAFPIGQPLPRSALTYNVLVTK